MGSLTVALGFNEGICVREKCNSVSQQKILYAHHSVNKNVEGRKELGGRVTTDIIEIIEWNRPQAQLTASIIC